MVVGNFNFRKFLEEENGIKNQGLLLSKGLGVVGNKRKGKKGVTMEFTFLLRDNISNIIKISFIISVKTWIISIIQLYF